jgi:hypothetical protein
MEYPPILDHLNAMKSPVTVIAATLAGGTLLCAGCASNNIQAQWTDPEFAGHSLRGEKVLVICDAADAAIKRVCQEQMTARLVASGAVPVSPTESDGLAAGASPINDKALAAARGEGAKAIWSAAIAPDATVVNPGPTVGFGMGSFGGGPGGGGVGAGVGMAVPVGNARVSTAYAANLVLTDVATGRMMWTSKVTTAASQDVAGQIEKLAQTGVEAAQKAGML